MNQIAVIGLGYVGLPVALAIAKKFPNTVGFDINQEKIAALNQGIDSTGEVTSDELKNTSLKITCETIDLADCNFFIVAVPTPIDNNRVPDLTPLIKASESIGKVLKKGDVVVYESTVYPGVTEEICGAVLARVSDLRQGVDFKLGYSPERINPGDKTHTLEKIVKVVAGEDPQTLEQIASVYSAIVDAGVYRAQSIKVAEAAKVIENTQRDLNIALMNELAIICDHLNIRTRDVLAAAGTKWNFLPFTPGLVGGHCIGVDPYYLTAKAQQVGYYPQVILAGRRINDNMGQFLGNRLVKMFVEANITIKNARVGILGLTFKENVPDLRNSRVPDIIHELRQFGIEPLVHDSLAQNAHAVHEYGIQLSDWKKLTYLDALILAVPHQEYLEIPHQKLFAHIRPGGIFMDIKSIFEPEDIPANINYWSL
ncbi:nucleotide sugar dehydrogenase [Dolichospermum planctonicum UHCC 0167]|jgi:UDP-N-acetyl-D-galactosamine dehydrogenase|uniref:nucleotide sugar dehydrogenase n=1 Tax=Dolichospermum planctonicum TaxID=136072 RepID=UPI001443098E|nr:nucleotide sugar dehydrogenase [Dolichospermum planctonicum]MCW9680960.1 nucleotide sugar dehydrogenase [Dolichospermum planctonicum UHCC 0167]